MSLKQEEKGGNWDEAFLVWGTEETEDVFKAFLTFMK